MIRKTIAINKNRKELSAISGILFFLNLINTLNLEGILGTLLPKSIRKSAISNKYKFIIGVFAFITGADCIEDLDSLRNDPIFAKVTNHAISSTTMGKFIRTIPLKYIQRLEKFLPQLALQLRHKLAPNDKEIIITMDSTPHQQYGQQMEGVAWNYKKIWCLDSQNAFDQYGLCYGWHLRAGNTYSSKGAADMIDSIFAKIPKLYKLYFRADSAYSTTRIYNTLLMKNIDFAICLKENVWQPLLKSNFHNMKWKKTKIQFFESNKCQIASTAYPVKGLEGRSFLRVVFIRAPKPKQKAGLHYRYYAIVTNMSEYERSNEQIIQFYRRRAQAENNIKDLKYGMDFLHFPSGKLNANRMWGLMGIFAYNLMRYSSFLVSPRGCFLKKVRQKLVFIAGRVVDHARKLHIHFSNNNFKEVQKFLEKIQNNQVVYYGQIERCSSA